jgi:iron(II)-dependent oxidoreductase
MDARNHTLYLLALFDGQPVAGAPAPSADGATAAWYLGHVAWFQEWWIARNLQRHQGSRCDPTSTRLASIEPRADLWWDGGQGGQIQPINAPGLALTRTYAMDTLEATLELLEKTPASDDGLYLYRHALAHEDIHSEDLLVLAQLHGIRVDLPAPGPTHVREPLLCPATRWVLGSDAGVNGVGFSFDNQRPAHGVNVPAFEIDAQAVTWNQFVEFVLDGGYDRAELWAERGWAWLQAQAAEGGRRGPRYVEQIGGASGAVLQTRFGQPRRMLGQQSACHLSWWEADAWCRWAGRRLPSELEWELAAHTATARGFRWGDVWEWTGTTLRGYPGFAPGPDRNWSEPDFDGRYKVMRGASFATRARMKNPKLRFWGLPQSDEPFVGFRSCAL